MDKGLSAQRIWQDLCAEHGFGHGYESVKRFVRTLRGRRPAVADVMEHPPGKEAQVDYFKSPAPVVNAATGKWGRPWIFRMTLSCSRHGYEEPMWDQQRGASGSSVLSWPPGSHATRLPNLQCPTVDAWYGASYNQNLWIGHLFDGAAYLPR